MAFSFGGINSSRKRSNTTDIKNYIIEENISGDKYYIILTDYVIRSSHLALLKKDLCKAGINNYCIISSISADKLAKDSTEALIEVESQWRTFLKFNEWNPRAIIAMGSAVRLIAGSGDLLWTDFLDFKFNNPYFYVSQKFRKITDRLQIYPVGPIDQIYPTQLGDDYTCWVTRHFQEQLKNVGKNIASKFKYDFSDYEIVDTLSERKIVTILNKLKNSDILAIDTETNSLDSTLKDSKIHSIQFSNDGKVAYFILWSDIEKYNLRDLVADCINSAKKALFSNGKFDFKFLWEAGLDIKTNNVWNTDSMSHSLNSHLLKGLKPLALRYTYLGGYDLQLDSIKSRLNISNYSQIPKDILMQYSGLDVIVCYRIFMALKDNIEYVDKKFINDKQPDWTIWRFIEEIFNPNYHLVMETERRGVFFNINKMREARDFLTKRESDLTHQFIDGVNKQLESKGLNKVKYDFPIESNKELPKLIESLGWRCIERNKDGQYGTGDACLEQWKQDGHAEAKILSELRTTKVGIKTFSGSTDDINDEDITGWPKYIREYEDGSARVHPDTKVMSAESFRHKMTSPNLQQIPSGNFLAPYLKKCISVPAYTSDGSYIKITDDNGKVWTTEYTDWFDTQRGIIHIKDMTENDEIINYAYPPEWTAKNNYQSKRVNK